MECHVCGELGVADHGCSDPICPVCKADGWVMGAHGPMFVEEEVEPEEGWGFGYEAYDDYAVEV